MSVADHMATRPRARSLAAHVGHSACDLPSGGVAKGPVVPTSRRWRLPSDVQEIGPVVQDIVSLCRDAGFSSRHCGLNVPVATTEALANAMLRGNGADALLDVEVVVEVSQTCLVVEVADHGGGFDLAAVQQSPAESDWLEREHGRGVFLMRALMDHVENYCQDGGAGHRLRLVLYRT